MAVSGSVSERVFARSAPFNTQINKRNGNKIKMNGKSAVRYIVVALVERIEWPCVAQNEKQKNTGKKIVSPPCNRRQNGA